MAERSTSFGEVRPPTVVDRFGVWLSGHRIRRSVADFHGLQIGDFGCGYDARFVRSVLPLVGGVVLVDVSLAPDLVAHPKVDAIEGHLPDALSKLDDASLDLAMSMSVLEHLRRPEVLLAEMRRLLKPGGVAIVNVPTWWGKRFLEFSAFRLGLSPAEEMDDHKRYYDPRDLWPLLIEAGFPPHGVRCVRHKFGLNTIAVCRLDKHQ